MRMAGTPTARQASITFIASLRMRKQREETPTYRISDQGDSRPVSLTDLIVPLAIAGLAAWFVVSRIRKLNRWWNRFIGRNGDPRYS
jgi:hypothetical protein